MPEIRRSPMVRLLRIIGLGAGVLALAGCASNDVFVQTDTGGGYYTSAASYPPPSYYADGDFGAYDPYGVAFGDYDIYGPSFTFGLGIGSPCGWGCAGYYGGWPWYYGPVSYRGWRHHHAHHHHGGTIVSAPHTWLGPDPPRVPLVDGTRGEPPPIAVPARPVENFASRRRLESASFAPQRDVGRVPPAAEIAERPAYLDLDREPASTMNRSLPIRMAPAHDFARPVDRVATPMRAAPPTSHGSRAGSDKIR